MITMKNMIDCLIASLLAGFTFNSPAADAPELKYGLYIHFGISTFAQPGERGEIPAARFAPVSVNAASWARLARESGMTFAVLTVKHESGFCLWPSADYDYDISQSPFKGDIIGDFIAACNAEGILPGAHYSLPDAHNEGNAHAQGPVPKIYFNLIKKQLTELHTKYPGLRLQAIDSSERFSPEQWDEITKAIKQVNPRCQIIDHSRGGVAHYADATVNQGWMWHANQKMNPAAQLFNAYNKAQSAHQAFILNVGPDPRGEVPEVQVAVLKTVKEMIANPPPAASATAPEAKPDAATRLKQVKSLYDQGLINKDDYDKKVKEIMDSL